MIFFSTSRNLFFNIIYIFPHGIATNCTSMVVLTVIAGIAICPMMPRFFIGVRELYDRDSRGRGQGIDGGFGILSQHTTSENATVSAIAFAEVAPGQDVETLEGNEEDPEAIRLEVIGDEKCGV